MRRLSAGVLFAAAGFLVLTDSAAIGQTYVLWNFSSSGDHFGHSVAAAGDVDGDGVPDWIVGAPHANVAGGTIRKGNAKVFSGATGGILFVFWGNLQGGRFGEAVAGGGDANADGVPDLAVGEPQGLAWPGTLTVFSGTNGAPIHVLPGIDASGTFGASCAFLEDIDGDGGADVIVGAPLADTVQGNDGEVYVFSGMTGSLIHNFGGTALDQMFGLSVADAGDVDGDGTHDVVVGSRWSLLPPVPSQARVFSGANGSPLWTFTAGYQSFVYVAGAVPAAPSLVGGLVRFQGYVVDPGPLPLPGAMTPRLDLRIVP